MRQLALSADFADNPAIYGFAYTLPISQARPILDKGQNWVSKRQVS
jgi:hypothetical protein